MTDMEKKMQCMIRMDDITPDMNFDNFNRIRAIFTEYHIRPLLGVVPDNQDPKLTLSGKKEDFWNMLCSLQKEGWSVAQHGTYHRYVTQDCGMLGLKSSSEFAGLSYEEQFEKLQAGKKILEEHGIFSDIFMAPGHTYDENTVKALKELGFRTITDGLYHKPYYYKDILFVPCRLQEYRNVKGIDTICLHSNLMSDGEIKELEAFCKKYQKNIIPFEPEGLKSYAVKRNVFVAVYEKGMLFIRKTKSKIANSKRLAWYMQYTNDKSSKKKWMKRIFCLPMLFLGGGKDK